MDLLAEVLAVTGVRGTVAATVEAGEGWGFSLQPVRGASFHAVTAGIAWLRRPDAPAVRLMPGDVLLLPTGIAHALASDAEGDLVPFEYLAAEQAVEGGGTVRVGSGPAQTRILCARYHHDSIVQTPLFTLLPEVMHISAGSASSALEDTVHLLSGEIAHPQLATATVLDRLVDVLLIQLLRAWLTTHPDTTSLSWLRSLSDPVAASALAALHADPARPWTIELLAREVAVSRATLARRFSSLVGESPAAYLTRWRMDLAARRLRDTDDTIGVIASSVGYTSEYAFSRAFSRARSQPPGRYRAHSRAEAIGSGRARTRVVDAGVVT